MHDRRPDVVNELFLDELMAIVNGIEDFTYGERRSGVLTNKTEALLQLGRCWIFEPEQMERFKTLPQARCFDRTEAVMRIMQQAKIWSEFLAQSFEQARHEVQVEL